MLTDMVTEDIDRSEFVCEATKNHDVFHVTSREKVDCRAWNRMLQDELLEEANSAKVSSSFELFAAIEEIIADLLHSLHVSILQSFCCHCCFSAQRPKCAIYLLYIVTLV